MKIPQPTEISVLNLALDTISIGKQALIFCNTKATAESTAEKIAKKIKGKENLDMAERVLHALSSPTKQCKRLSMCLRKGIAFHHSGLAAKQREIVEDNFRSGEIKIICATTSLAFGLNLPAFRAIIKDLKRYGGRWGMQWIPVLEYHQMIGRAGRPDFNDEFGEAICIAASENDKEKILDKFLLGEPEEIISKLAVEPVLRTYVLSLISVGFVKSREQLNKFFENTFFGHQRDIIEIQHILDKVISMLIEWEFISGDDFVSADAMDELKATRLGERVAQLYIDPYTANFLITCMQRASAKVTNEFSMLHMVTNTLELRPYFRARTAEIPEIEQALAEHDTNIIVAEPSVYEAEYDEYLNSTKTALVLLDWIDERDENYILENYKIRPGELHIKKQNADWILYAASEISQIMAFHEINKEIKKTRYRIKNGIKEELIPLVRIKGIGRVRARKLFRNGIKDVGDVKSADYMKLVQIIGRSAASNLKSEVGQEVEEVKPNKRKGQKSMYDY